MSMPWASAQSFAAPTSVTRSAHPRASQTRDGACPRDFSSEKRKSETAPSKNDTAVIGFIATKPGMTRFKRSTSNVQPIITRPAIKAVAVAAKVPDLCVSEAPLNSLPTLNGFSSIPAARVHSFQVSKPFAQALRSRGQQRQAERIKYVTSRMPRMARALSTGQIDTHA